MTQTALMLCAHWLQLLYFVLVFFTWKKTRSVPLLILHVIFYYYTFQIYLLVSVAQDFQVNNLALVYPFAVTLDRNFYLGWLMLLIFANIYTYLLIILCPSYIGASLKGKDSNYCISSRYLLFLSFLILTINCVIWKDEIRTFLIHHTSGYISFKRGEAFLGAYYPLVRLSLEFLTQALFLLIASGFTLIRPVSARPGERFFTLVLIVASFFFFLMMGDRQSLISGFLFITVLIFFDPRQTKQKMAFFLAAFVLINSIAYLRTKSPNHRTPEFESVKGIANSIVLRGESVTGLSMYNLIAHDAPPFNGGSLKFLIASLVPRIIRPSRPMAPYSYYVRAVGIEERLGVPLHYAADWYMNFRLIGLFAGAVILALFHSFLYRWSLKSKPGRFFFAGMIGALPMFMRSGPDFKSTAYSMILAGSVYFFGTLTPSLWRKPNLSLIKLLYLSRFKLISTSLLNRSQADS